MTDPSIEADNAGSGRTASVWRHDARPGAWSEGGRDQADVCVVGAGIAGLTTAYLLSAEGRSVIVVDAKPPGGGETGRTSAHLASAIDDRFAHLEKSMDARGARTAYESHSAAIDLIERIVREEKIDCDFVRVDGLLFSGAGVDLERLDEEFVAAKRAGFAGVERATASLHEGGRPLECIRFPRQARFHPMKYLAGLVRVLESRGVTLRSGRVTELSGDGPVQARLEDGGVIRAGWGVAATNVPGPIRKWSGVYTKFSPYRTYVITARVPPGRVRDALIWDMQDPYHYVRLHHDEHGDLLIIGGEDHKTGQPPENPEEPFRRLEAWTRIWFPEAGEIEDRWSGQVAEPHDGVAFIGRAPPKGHGACFVITGDSGMGLTHGTLGAMLVTDLIQGRPNPWRGLYDPTRRPTGDAGTFVKENLNAAAAMRDRLTAGEVESADDVGAGCGAIVRRGLHKVAVYRDAEGRLHQYSAVCPHLGCIVRWNPVESSWDCPCHGSRFDAKGRQVTGPAVEDLGEPP